MQNNNLYFGYHYHDGRDAVYPTMYVGGGEILTVDKDSKNDNLTLPLTRTYFGQESSVESSDGHHFVCLPPHESIIEESDYWSALKLQYKMLNGDYDLSLYRECLLEFWEFMADAKDAVVETQSVANNLKFLHTPDTTLDDLYSADAEMMSYRTEMDAMSFLSYVLLDFEDGVKEYEDDEKKEFIILDPRLGTRDRGKITIVPEQYANGIPLSADDLKATKRMFFNESTFALLPPGISSLSQLNPELQTELNALADTTDDMDDRLREIQHVTHEIASVLSEIASLIKYKEGVEDKKEAQELMLKMKQEKQEKRALEIQEVRKQERAMLVNVASKALYFGVMPSLVLYSLVTSSLFVGIATIGLLSSMIAFEYDKRIKRPNKKSNRKPKALFRLQQGSAGNQYVPHVPPTHTPPELSLKHPVTLNRLSEAENLVNRLDDTIQSFEREYLEEIGVFKGSE